MRTILMIYILIQTSLFAQTVPDFELQDIDGNIRSYEEIKGKQVTLIDFWATYCKPCQRSFPELKSLYEEFREQGVQIIGVNLDGPRSLSKVKPFVASMQVAWPILKDTNKEVMQDLNVTAMPTLYIVNHKDEIVFTHEGFKAGDEKILREEIQSLIREKKP